MSPLLMAGALAVLSDAAPAPPWPQTVLDRALESELARAATGLALTSDGYQPPYFISLRTADVSTEETRCSLGAVRSRIAQSQRVLTADVRVGSRELDNHPAGPSGSYVGQEIPKEDDAFSLRHALWQELDERYKGAAADFLRKQAQRVQRGKTEYDTDDMTREDPVALDASKPMPAWEGGEALCRELSSAFRERPQLLQTRVLVEFETTLHRLFSTEGARVRRSEGTAWVALDATAMTADGMKVFASRSFLAPGPWALPPKERLLSAAREMIADLDALRASSSTSPFSAPALVDPSVGAAVLQALATRLSGEQQRNPEGAQTFRGKLGKKILPEFLSLTDDPLLPDFKGDPLMGCAQVDDEGVSARRVSLVERGVLKGYLLSRHPVIGFKKSNGHGRAVPGRRPTGRVSSLILTAEPAQSSGKLLDLLRAECRRQGKPYGLWIRKARSWRQQDTVSQQQAFRLLPTLIHLVEAETGRLTLVRDLDMVGTPLDLAGKILAAGDDFQAVHSVVDDVSGNLPVSTVVPSLLLQEVELQRADTKPERQLILPAPDGTEP